MNIRKIGQKLSLQEFLLIGIVIFYLGVQQILTSNYKSLPSPIYGGDFYFQLGSIIHIMEGGNPLESPNFLEGGTSKYQVLYSTLAAYFGRALSLNPINSMFYFSQILIVSSLVAIYFFLKYLTKNKNLALLGALVFLPLTSFPVLKYTGFTYVLMTPLFFYSLIYFLRKKSVKSGFVVGLVSGLCTISHGAMMFTVLLSLSLVFIYLLFLQFFKIEKKGKKTKFIFKLKEFKNSFLDTSKLLIIIVAIAFPISLMYWYEPIFIYHGNMPNPMHKFGFKNFSSFKLQIDFATKTIKRFFFKFDNLKSAILSIFSLFGLFMSFKKKRKNLFLFFLIAFLGTFHYFLTEPLLNIHFAPPRVRKFTFPILQTALVLFGVSNLKKYIKRYRKYLIMILIISLLIFNYKEFREKIKTNKWVQVGKKSLPSHFVRTRKWVLKNTDLNDVFLSTNELSFALNALTGRKLLITRRAHSSFFINFDRREADAAVILYGNSNLKRKKLLEKYSVDYLYWNPYWIKSEYRFDRKGRIRSWLDPIVVLDKPKYRKYFKKYNVIYKPMHTWLDPAMKGPDRKKTDLLFVIPNYRNPLKPWLEDLDKYLKPVWGYEEKNQTISRIYKIK